MVNLFERLADTRNPASFAAALRRRRHALFAGLLARVPRPLAILDVGGTAAFWRSAPLDLEGVSIAILNLAHEETGDPRLTSLVGDARDLGRFGDGAVDVVYSNSVIEHVGAFADQRRMAEEIRRVGKRYFVQTPNMDFPIEPHFLFPGFQFMPLELRTFLHRRFRLGWFERQPDLVQARRDVAAIRLLREDEFRSFFPGATLYRERFLGLTKSFIAYHGWP
ncbi:MAG: class I SAM-dependent methyltransferase [Vulcanimicrobiaceae bacterium]